MQTRLLYFLFALLFFSCNSSSLLDKQDDFARAEQLLETQPDSALGLANGWLTDTAVDKINPQSLTQIYLLKERAFSKKFQVDSVLHYAQLIRELAAPANDSMAIAESLLFIVGDMDESEKAKIEKLLPASIRQMENAGRTLDVAKLEGKYGIILATKGDYNQSQPHLIKAYTILKDSSRKRELISICLGLASNFSAIGSGKESLRYYLEAYQIASELKDADRLTLVLINLGYYYASTRNLDSSRYYYDLAKSTASPNAQFIVKTKIDYNVNLNLMADGKYLQAQKGFRNMLDSVKGTGMLEAEAMIQKALSQNYLALGQTEAAIQSLNRSLVLADSLKDNAIKIESSEILRDIYIKKGDYYLAYQQQMLYQQMKDSMLSKEKQVAIHDLEEKYQSEKKELENKALRSTLSLRNLGILGLVSLISALAIIIVILRQRNRYHLERTRSYEVLMEKYRAELKLLSSEERKEDDSVKSTQILAEHPIHPSRSTSSTEVLAVKDANEKEGDLENELLNRLKLVMKKEKPYLNTKLKVEDVANKMNVTERKLSQMLKEHEGVSFNYFVNQYRVEEARRLMDQPDSFHLKLEVIAQNAGFGSRQSFYNYFEQFTGVNPGYYREAIHSSNK